MLLQDTVVHDWSEPEDASWEERTEKTVASCSTGRQKVLLDTHEVAFSTRITGIACELAKTLCDKNKAYGDSFNKTAALLAILYAKQFSLSQEGDTITVTIKAEPIGPNQYTRLPIVTRKLDKICRYVTNNDPYGENPLMDDAGYDMLALEADQRGK